MKSGSLFLKNSSISIFCLLLLMNQVVGQSNPIPTHNDLKQIATPSPNASSLGQYGDVPVGLYTGSTQIDVPLYEIKEGTLNLPISLSYKSGGIKVAEFAPWTGLGWTLNAGGAIARTVFGKPDDGGLLDAFYSVPLNPTFAQAKHDLMGNVDYEPDIFYFNFNGRSGKFVLNQTSSIVISPYQNLKIQASGANGSYMDPPFSGMGAISKFKITDENGVIYEFKDDETTQMVGTYNPLTPESTYKGPYTMPPCTSSWYLSGMYSPNGDSIRFIYGNYDLAYEMPSSEQQYVSMSGTGVSYGYNGATFLAPDPVQPNLVLGGKLGAIDYSSPQPTLTESVAKYQTQNKRLQQILFSNGSLVFYADSVRYDLIGDSALGHLSILRNNGQVLKGYSFHYQYNSLNNGLKYASQLQPNAVSDNTYETYASNINVSYNSSAQRLMLTGVSELDSNGSAIGKNYKFGYDLSYGGLPDRFSKARDYWGYSNGSSDNENSFLNYQINGQDATNPSNYLIIGKDPDLNYCRQNSLNMVTYPTAGTTQLNYELHDAYLGPQVIPPPVVPQNCSMVIDYSNYANLQYTDTMINGVEYYYSLFSVNSTGAAINIAINNMMYQGDGLNYIMRFDIYNAATNQVFLQMSDIIAGGVTTYHDINPTTRVYTYTLNGYYFPNGVYRVLFKPNTGFIGNSNYFNTYGGNPSCIINGWSNIVGNPTVANISRSIGGLRIQSTMDYEPVTGKSLQKNYSYTVPGQSISSGSLVCGLNYVYPLNQIYQGTAADDNSIYAMFSYMIVNGESNYPLSTTQGSNVGYSTVSVTETDPVSGNINGKSEYHYTFYNDQYAGSNGPVNNYPFTPADSRDWLRGLLTQKIDYKYSGQQFTAIKYENYNYGSPIFLGSVNGYTARYAQQFMLGTSDTTSIIGGPDPNSPWPELIGGASYTYTSGYMPLLTKATTVVADDGSTLTNTESYTYGDAPTNMLPTKIVTMDSKGESITTSLTYPTDYSVANPVTSQASGLLTLQQAHILSPVIEKYVQRTTGSGANIGVVSGAYMTFKPAQPSVDTVFRLEAAAPVLNYTPVSISGNATSMDAHYLPIVSFGSYDNKGNLLQQRKINDLSQTYLWDYNAKYPIAEVKNALPGDIAYTSFEADGAGNWTIPDTSRNRGAFITGGISYNLNAGNTITRSGLNGNNTYIVSYWSTGGALNVNGSTAISGTSIGTWTYYEHTVTGAPSISISGNATIDELRLFPKGSLMTTYTFTPLVGMTSQCSPTNYITNYSYDGLQRLKFIKDMRGNIIKTMDYHYQGQ